MFMFLQIHSYRLFNIQYKVKIYSHINYFCQASGEHSSLGKTNALVRPLKYYKTMLIILEKS